MVPQTDGARASAGMSELETFESRLEDERANSLQAAKHAVVVVQNVPVVEEQRYAKLRDTLTKLFFKLGALREPAAVTVPQDPATKKTIGVAFVAYMYPEEASRAVAKMHGYKFGRDPLTCHTLAEIERVAGLAPEFREEDFQDRIPTDASMVPNLTQWMLDSRGRNQYACMAAEEAEIFWFDPISSFELAHGRMRWTDSFIQWSPRGSYLATFHPQGIALWGGPNWAQLMRFPHAQVKHIDFSPNEKYLVTSSGLNPAHDNGQDPTGIIVWEVATCKRLRGFLAQVFESKIAGPRSKEETPEFDAMWPVFKWSHDDKFLARLNEDAISVYGTPDMGLLDKRSTKVPGVRDIAWSPSDNYLAYWAPEIENSPARVSLMEFPSRKEIRQKALYSVADIRLHWQRAGNFLCCKVDRLTKSKKGQFTNFELFRAKAKNIPIETLEYKEKDTITAFAWEPVGSRFGVIHGDSPGRFDVSLYSMEGVDGQLKHLTTLEKKKANNLFWSPQGGILVMAGLGNMNGTLEWYNVNESESMGTGEHFMCTDVGWDPSGRFLATSVSYWRHKMENGFAIWNILGKDIVHVSKSQFKQFLWRPRPASLLTPKDVREVKKEFKGLREQFEREDEELRESRRSGKAARKRELREPFRAYEQERNALAASEEEARIQARNGRKAEDPSDYEILMETVEEIVEVKQDIDFNRKKLTSEDERD